MHEVIVVTIHRAIKEISAADVEKDFRRSNTF